MKTTLLNVNNLIHNLIYFPLTNRKGEQVNFVSELFIRVSYRCLISFVHHVVRDVQLGAQEKLFVPMTLSEFIELCRIMEM